MFKQGGRRVSHPIAPTWATEDGSAANPFDGQPDIAAGTASVWGSVYSFLRGSGYHTPPPSGPPASAEQVQEAAASLLEGHRAEIVRMGAAYLLGNAAREGHAEAPVAASEDNRADVGTCTVEVNGALEVEGAVVLVCAAAVPAIVTVRTVLVAHATAVRAHTRTLTCSP